MRKPRLEQYPILSPAWNSAPVLHLGIFWCLKCGDEATAMEYSSACASPLLKKKRLLTWPSWKRNYFVPDGPHRRTTDTGHTWTWHRGEQSLYHVVLLGRRDWQKDLGTGAWRELNRLRRGLQSRDWLWTSREACGTGKRKGRYRER